MSYKGKTVIYMRGHIQKGEGSITLYYADRTKETIPWESCLKAAHKK